MDWPLSVAEKRTRAFDLYQQEAPKEGVPIAHCFLLHNKEGHKVGLTSKGPKKQLGNVRSQKLGK